MAVCWQPCFELFHEASKALLLLVLTFFAGRSFAFSKNKSHSQASQLGQAIHFQWPGCTGKFSKRVCSFALRNTRCHGDSLAWNRLPKSLLRSTSEGIPPNVVAVVQAARHRRPAGLNGHLALTYQGALKRRPLLTGRSSRPASRPSV